MPPKYGRYQPQLSGWQDRGAAPLTRCSGWVQCRRAAMPCSRRQDLTPHRNRRIRASPIACRRCALLGPVGLDRATHVAVAQSPQAGRRCRFPTTRDPRLTASVYRIRPRWEYQCQLRADWRRPRIRIGAKAAPALLLAQGFRSAWTTLRAKPLAVAGSRRVLSIYGLRCASYPRSPLP